MKLIKVLYSLLINLYRLLKGMVFRLFELLSQVLPESSTGCFIRGLIYKPFLGSCGKNFQVGIGVKLEHLSNIYIGDDVYIGHCSWVSGLRGGVTLSDQVMLGPFVKMVSSNHTKIDGSFRFGPGVGAQIKIGRGAWIGAGVMLTAGSIVAAGSLVAAGSVVTKEFSNENMVVAGVPAKEIGKC